MNDYLYHIVNNPKRTRLVLNLENIKIISLTQKDKEFIEEEFKEVKHLNM